MRPPRIFTKKLIESSRRGSSGKSQGSRTTSYNVSYGFSKFPYETLVTATRNFSNLIDEGYYGSVYRGVLTGLKPGIAVKQLKQAAVTGVSRDDLAKLAHDIARASHPNIVKFVGYCESEEEIQDPAEEGKVEASTFRKALRLPIMKFLELPEVIKVISEFLNSLTRLPSWRPSGTEEDDDKVKEGAEEEADDAKGEGEKGAEEEADDAKGEGEKGADEESDDAKGEGEKGGEVAQVVKAREEKNMFKPGLKVVAGLKYELMKKQNKEEGAKKNDKGGSKNKTFVLRVEVIEGFDD